MKNSKAKGDGFERLIASMLGEALGITLKRTPLSGGWSRENPDVRGDIVCTDPGPMAFPYCVECKKQEGWKLESLFTDKHKWFDNWWAQLVEDCPDDRTPLLVFSRAWVPAFVSFPVELFMKASHSTSAYESGQTWNVPYFMIDIPIDITVAVMRLSDFVSYLL